MIGSIPLLVTKFKKWYNMKEKKVVMIFPSGVMVEVDLNSSLYNRMMMYANVVVVGDRTVLLKHRYPVYTLDEIGLSEADSLEEARETIKQIAIKGVQYEIR